MTGTADAIRAVLADGDWHTLDELLTAAAHTVEPGRAYRAGERHRLQKLTAPKHRVKGGDQDSIDAGRRRIIFDAIQGLTKRGKVERVDGRYRTTETRLPIVRRLRDDTVTDGTARQVGTVAADFTVDDFRDLQGRPLDLPPGACFEVSIPFGEPT